MVSRPILESSLHNLELKREKSVKQVCLGIRRFNGIEDGKEIGTFRRGLVEESEAG